MKIDTLKDRIQKAEEKITKKQGTIERMRKTIAKNLGKIEKLGFTREDVSGACWSRDEKKYDAILLAYSIENAEESIKNAEEEIAYATEKLAEYKAQLTAEQEKASSRDIKAIVDFLNSWKESVMKYYTETMPMYIMNHAAVNKLSNKYYEWYTSQRKSSNYKEECSRLYEEHRAASKAFNARYAFLLPYVTNDELDTKKLAKDLDDEANRKYDFIIERTNEIVGQITDASALRIGSKGDLNGIIKGTRGAANVQTVGAGGYNIQCFHFRTLIHAC